MRLRLEALEDRLAPAQLYWDPPGIGNPCAWSDAFNWRVDGINGQTSTAAPGPSDNVFFTASQIPCDIDTNVRVNSLNVLSDFNDGSSELLGYINVYLHELRVDATATHTPSAIDSGAFIVERGGTVVFAGSPVTWHGEAGFWGGGTVALIDGTDMTIGDSDKKTCDARLYIENSTVTMAFDCGQLDFAKKGDIQLADASATLNLLQLDASNFMGVTKDPSNSNYALNYGQIIRNGSGQLAFQLPIYNRDSASLLQITHGYLLVGEDVATSILQTAGTTDLWYGCGLAVPNGYLQMGGTFETTLVDNSTLVAYVDGQLDCFGGKLWMSHNDTGGSPWAARLDVAGDVNINCDFYVRHSKSLSWDALRAYGHSVTIGPEATIHVRNEYDYSVARIYGPVAVISATSVSNIFAHSYLGWDGAVPLAATYSQSITTDGTYAYYCLTYLP
jgi:hypothetical protein